MRDIEVTLTDWEALAITSALDRAIKRGDIHAESGEALIRGIERQWDAAAAKRRESTA